MRIHTIEIDNFMRLRVVRLTPKGNLIQLTGENGSGKTSFLTALLCAVSGKGALPKVPVHAGEGHARIRLDLGDVIIRWHCTPDREPTVILESAKGARFPKPLTLINELYSAIAFDPQAFQHATPKERLEILRRLVPLDVDVDALDRLNAADYAERTDINRRIKALQERTVTLAQGIVPDMDVTPIDTAKLVEEMGRASEQNMAVEREKSRRADWLRQVNQLDADALRIQQEIDRLQAQLATNRDNAAQVRAQIADAEPLAATIDTTALAEEIKRAERTNVERRMQAEQRQKHHEALTEEIKAREASEALTVRMAKRTQAKAEAIAKAKMPVEGLAFGDGDVLYKGLPFDQASDADQWIVTLGIGAAANPKLRVILIRAGSLLDERNLALVDAWAEEHDYQVFMEVVRKDSKVGVAFVGGEIVAVDGVPVEQPAEAVA